MKRSFTLIELLIVVIIIGILTALAVPQYQKHVNRAKVTHEMAYLIRAIQMVKATTGRYPPGAGTADYHIYTLEEWKNPANGLVDSDGSFPNWAGPYVEGPDDIFTDPWGVNYYFDGNPDLEPGPGQTAIISAGPDKRFEGGYNDPEHKSPGDDIVLYLQ